MPIKMVDRAVAYQEQERSPETARVTANGMDRLLPHPASLRGLAAVNRRSSNEAGDGIQ